MVKKYIWILVVFLFIFLSGCINKDICGNNICETSENINNCLNDCKSNKPIQENLVISDCGDGICKLSETKYNCPTDCGIPLPECGNNKCETDYTINPPFNEAFNCPTDCGIICGDGVCYESIIEGRNFGEVCSEDCINSPYRCGNSKCEAFEDKNNCPQDCTLYVRPSKAICGDGYCSNIYNEDKNNCPQDCTITLLELPEESIQKEVQKNYNEPIYDNSKLIGLLNTKQRPLSGGLGIQIPAGADRFCTLGAIIRNKGIYYGLTAGHCFDVNNNFKVDNDEIGLKVSQGGGIIGTTTKGIKEGLFNDIGIISINNNIDKTTQTFLGDNIDGWETPKVGMEVFKIGMGSGLTNGKIVFVSGDGFRIESSKPFAWSTDSGSVVLTKTNPKRILGIIILGGECTENKSKNCVWAISQDKIVNFLP